jgi:hypothetical protein
MLRQSECAEIMIACEKKYYKLVCFPWKKTMLMFLLGDAPTFDLIQYTCFLITAVAIGKMSNLSKSSKVDFAAQVWRRLIF